MTKRTVSPSLAAAGLEQLAQIPTPPVRIMAGTPHHHRLWWHTWMAEAAIRHHDKVSPRTDCCSPNWLCSSSLHPDSAASGSQCCTQLGGLPGLSPALSSRWCPTGPCGKQRHAGPSATPANRPAEARHGRKVAPQANIIPLTMYQHCNTPTQPVHAAVFMGSLVSGVDSNAIKHTHFDVRGSLSGATLPFSKEKNMAMWTLNNQDTSF